jgi:hypothetical protein
MRAARAIIGQQNLPNGTHAHVYQVIPVEPSDDIGGGLTTPPVAERRVSCFSTARDCRQTPQYSEVRRELEAEAKNLGYEITAWPEP